MENIVSTMIIVKKIRITIIKKFIRPWYGRLLYPYCQARLSHRLLLNKKRGAKKKATLSQKLVYVMATLCDILLYQLIVIGQINRF